MSNIWEQSFSDAKAIFTKNLALALLAKQFTPTSFAMTLNMNCTNSVVNSLDVTEWLAGTKLPTVYQMYKIGLVLGSLDELFSNPTTQIADTTITTATIIGSPLTTPLTPATTTSQENSMATKNTVVSISKTSKRKMDEVVRSRTASRTYNVLLANKIYSSDMTLKEIASKVGASTRSIRDYAFYGTTIPTEVANRFVSLFKTSYRNLGLYFNEDTNRFNHMKVTAKN